ncbi:thiamine phosphate synthase [Peptacetobacter sp.]|uniref:thiamine phosphate synthase n=1 Tax=Peptacetobacter sp. TaxID=2991975 RepID=UPI002616C406|nr:thiamine phosphate synthase [Peptacetobacter sp.]
MINLYLITNRALCSKEDYFKRIKEACLNGVDNIIIREKDLTDEEVIDIYEKISQSLPVEVRKKTSILVNSKFKVYEETDCDGIHLPFWLFKDKLKEGYDFKIDKQIGLSLHSAEEVAEMEEICSKYGVKVSYITLSHIYETKCKEGLKPKGLELLKMGGKLTKVKIVALGGIDSSNAAETLKYCDDIAVMSLIMKSIDVKKTVEELINCK